MVNSFPVADGFDSSGHQAGVFHQWFCSILYQCYSYCGNSLSSKLRQWFHSGDSRWVEGSFVVRASWKRWGIFQDLSPFSCSNRLLEQLIFLVFEQRTYRVVSFIWHNPFYFMHSHWYGCIRLLWKKKKKKPCRGGWGRHLSHAQFKCIYFYTSHKFKWT
jgi:hypothetical protein